MKRKLQTGWFSHTNSFLNEVQVMNILGLKIKSQISNESDLWW